MTTETEHATAALLADQDRKTTALIEGLDATAINQVQTAGETLAKHLRTAPAGTTIRDLMDAHEIQQPTT